MPRIANINQLKSHLASKVDASADDVLTVMLESAERFVERYTGRRFSPDPELVSGEDIEPSITKTIGVTPADRLVRVPDVREVVSVTLDGASLFEDDYDLGNYSEDSPSTQIELFSTATPSLSRPRSPLEITGRFGFLAPPADIIDAVLTIAARRYRERDAGFSDYVQMPEGAVNAYFKQLPSNVKAILQSYKIPRIAILNPGEAMVA